MHYIRGLFISVDVKKKIIARGGSMPLLLST